MSWFGKILFGTTGYLLGGPIVGCLGFIRGDELDQLISADYVKVKCPHCKTEGIIYEEGFHQCSQCSTEAYYFNFNSREDYYQFAHTMFFYLLYHFCKADGIVTKEKITIVMDFLLYDFGYDIYERQTALKIFNSTKYTDLGTSEIIHRYYYCFQDDKEALRGTLNLLFKIANSDNKLSKTEENFIRTVAKVFQLDEDTFEVIKSKYFNDMEKFYKTLGCQQSDSLEIIKQKFKTLAQSHHPDKFSHQKLDDSELQKITANFVEILEAYEKILNNLENK